MGAWTSDERADMARTLLHITSEAARIGNRVNGLRSTVRDAEAEIDRAEPDAKAVWACIGGLRQQLGLADTVPMHWNVDAVLDATRTEVAELLAACGEPAQAVQPDSMGPERFHKLNITTDKGVGLTGDCPCGWSTFVLAGAGDVRKMHDAYADHFEPTPEQLAWAEADAEWRDTLKDQGRVAAMSPKMWRDFVDRYMAHIEAQP